MNKILLNILIFVGFQQIILGDLKSKKGICLQCLADNCGHDKNTKCENCYKQVYSVCSQKHTMCQDCIYDQFNNDLKNNQRIIKCCAKGCKEEIKANIIQKILNNLIKEANKQKKEEDKEKYKKELKGYNEHLEERQLEKEISKDPNLKRCDYPNCKGYFSINKWWFFFTKAPICNKNKEHIHCKKCFRKKHEGECLPEFDEIIKRNREIQKKKEKNELQQWDSEGFKPCPKCLVITEKISGCNHMTCVYCKHQWCWRCGATCFLDDPENTEGANHYGGTAEKPNSECRGKHDVYEKNEEDGNYFGISNGNFENDFKYLEKNKRIPNKHDSYIENNSQQCCDNCTNFFENFL